MTLTQTLFDSRQGSNLLQDPGSLVLAGKNGIWPPAMARLLRVASNLCYYPFCAVDAPFGESPFHFAKLSLERDSFFEMAPFVEVKDLDTSLLRQRGIGTPSG